MFNPNISDRALFEASKEHNIELVRYDDTRLDEMLEKLHKTVEKFDDDGRPIKMARQLAPSERAFIKNERLVCKYDFNYFFTRYCHTQIKIPGQPVVVGRIKEPLESQRIFLEIMSRKEALIYEGIRRGEPTDGIMLAACKARQEGFTTVARGITMHRGVFYDDLRAYGISVDEDMVKELYDRDHTIYDNLPWWMKPEIEYDVKGKHLTFGKMGSTITYAQGNKIGGIGTGKTIGLTHVTELGVWETLGADPEKLMFDLDPTWPQSPDTWVFAESTSNGRTNYWYQFIQASIKARTRFGVVFCPWYCEPRYNRRMPPIGWEPLPHTKAMMETVERTSPSYLLGKTARLDAQQAYWWESQYEEFRTLGRLAYFLTNYPTTLDESFQVSGNRAFSVETIDMLRRGLKGGVPYEHTNTQPVGRIGVSA